MPIERLTIVGTGLIGASVGLAAKQAGVAEVSGFDPDQGALAVAAEKGAVDHAAASLAEALAGAELAVVAAPVTQLARQVGAVLELSAEACTVTDVGSTKAARLLGGGRFGAVRRRPSGLRLRGARPGERERRALPGRDVVPDAPRRHRRRALPARPRLRDRSRRHRRLRSTPTRTTGSSR